MECTKCAFIKLNKISNQSKGIMKKNGRQGGQLAFYVPLLHKKFRWIILIVTQLYLIISGVCGSIFGAKKCGPLIQWQHV